MDRAAHSMPTPHDPRLPASTRHAFALAFDLAVRRDALHSLVVPLLLRAPWIVALALLPPLDQTEQPGRVMLLSSVALLGDYLMLMVVGAMLRFRARSVFNTPPAAHPAPALECYARGLRRLPWLIVTEIVRNLALLFATFFFVVPAIVLGYRLAFATEAVVLDEPHLSGAFQRSFRLSSGRFERWFEMIVVSVFLALAAVFAVTVLSLLVPGAGVTTWVAICWLLVTAFTPVIQYAWTFFYLRLVEADAELVEVGPAYAGADLDARVAGAGHGARLTLVEPARSPEPEPGAPSSV
jgi:hypothetical protein